MTGAYATARNAAIDWAVRSQDARFEDWEALEDWLGADPLHAELYDAATIAADDAAKSIGQERSASAPVVPMRLASSPRRWLPFALAASIVAAVAGGGLLVRQPPHPTGYTISTASAERRTIRLPGSIMVLDGDTQVTLDRSDPRIARIDRGQVLFTVAHDPAHPFRVDVGDLTVTDIGTVFNIERSADANLIGVAQGAVRIGTRAGDVNLSAGQMVSIADVGGHITTRTQDPASIGTWRSGRIDFTDTRLDVLAERFHRATGARITVAPDIARHLATGTISASGDVAATFRTLAALLDISIERHEDRWLWSAHPVDSPA